MKKIIFLLCFLFAMPSFAEIDEFSTCPPPGRGQTYHPQSGHTLIKPFYNRKKSPKKKNKKNMPSMTRHIG